MRVGTWVMVCSKFTFGDGHSDAFDAFCMSKITKWGLQGLFIVIYHHIDRVAHQIMYLIML